MAAAAAAMAACGANKLLNKLCCETWLNAAANDAIAGFVLFAFGVVVDDVVTPVDDAVDAIDGDGDECCDDGVCVGDDDDKLVNRPSGKFAFFIAAIAAAAAAAAADDDDDGDDEDGVGLFGDMRLIDCFDKFKSDSSNDWSALFNSFTSFSFDSASLPFMSS